MTQREFWKEIEARTSKEVADFGFEAIIEGDLPGTVMREEDGEVSCADLDLAARAAETAFFKFSEA